MIEVLRAVGIVPVVKINRAAPAAGLARALCEGGLPAVEITFRYPRGLRRRAGGLRLLRDGIDGAAGRAGRGGGG